MGMLRVIFRKIELMRQQHSFALDIDSFLLIRTKQTYLFKQPFLILFLTLCLLDRTVITLSRVCHLQNRLFFLIQISTKLLRPTLKFCPQLLLAFLLRVTKSAHMRDLFTDTLLHAKLYRTPNQHLLILPTRLLPFIKRPFQYLIFLPQFSKILLSILTQFWRASHSSAVCSIYYQLSSIINQNMINPENSLIFNMQAVPKVEYLPCDQQGFHYGEVLNMICLEDTCQHNILCCCACVEEKHKDHNTKPLRLALLEASNNAKNIKQASFNIDIALELINSNLKSSIETIRKYKEDLTQNLQKVQNYITDYHVYLIEQVQLKHINPLAQIQKAFKVVQTPQPNPKDYVHMIKRLADLLGVKKQEKTLTEADIIDSLKTNTKTYWEHIKTTMNQVAKTTDTFCTSLQVIKKNIDLWKEHGFKFLPEFKHPDIKILSDMVVKSSNSSGYKFAIMDPTLEDGSNIKQMAFRIKQSHSNWVAVGMCHKNIVKSKNYGFNFSSIGHGAYMVSANGGSWSNTNAQQNNSIKSFDYKKDEIICIQINFTDKTIIFKKNSNPTQKHTLNFTTIQGDELCPCVLFYYINDEVEFLPNHKF